MKQYTSITEYINAQPKEHQPYLKKLRATIKKAAPKSEEIISYGMPAYKYHGALSYFSLTAKHFGFYPGSGRATEHFKDRLENYDYSKGTIRLPLDKPMPVKLISDIIKFRVKQNEAKLALKKPKKVTK
jgi:uncharacterized protein YdhG (YjbR/CyaY superfamily)